MNIVIYASSFLPIVGGREIVVHYLAQALTELGHNVRLFGHGGCWNQRKTSFGYPVHRWPMVRGRFAYEIIGFTELLLDTAIWGCDVIHAHGTYPPAYLVARLKQIRKAPLIVTPHGEDIHVIPEIGYGQRLDPQQRPKIRHCLQNADIITCLSSNIEASVLDAGGDREKMRRVPNGVDIRRFQQVSAMNVRKWLKLSNDSRLIITVGNYRPIKGHEILVRSMPLILSREGRARLVIVGKHDKTLQSLIYQLGLEDKVVLTGPLGFPKVSNNGARMPQEPDMLPAILHESEVYVSAGMAEGAEGLSLSVLEAMAGGLPIVATNISGNKDVVFDGISGLLVPPADHVQIAKAVLHLLDNPQLRKHMGSKSREIAGRYSWLEIARRYLDVYSEAKQDSIGTFVHRSSEIS